jgi:hypothetical protein
MNLLEEYLHEMHEIRASGNAVKETSYYPAISNLFNGIGKALKPKVRCIINIKNRGAGIPDGGLFSPDQFQRSAGGEVPEGTIPARGVIEIKPTSEDAWVVADGPQVTRYWGKYRQVLVTNYRDFVLVGQDIEGKPTKLETFRLAASEAQFWKAAGSAKKTADKLAPSFEEFLKRVLLNTATLANPQDVAWFLASYAREAKFRTDEGHLPALTIIRTALEEALGMKFDTQRGEHFFRSTLIQTLFYGMFSAWVLWSKTHLPTDKKARFDWRLADYYLRVPILRKLFREVAGPASWSLSIFLKCSTGLALCSTALTVHPSLPPSMKDRPCSISTNPFWKRSTLSYAKSSGCGIRRVKWSAIWSSAWIGSCARNSIALQDLPIRRFIYSTLVAVRALFSLKP